MCKIYHSRVVLEVQLKQVALRDTTADHLLHLFSRKDSSQEQIAVLSKPRAQNVRLARQ